VVAFGVRCASRRATHELEYSERFSFAAAPLRNEKVISSAVATSCS